MKKTLTIFPLIVLSAVSYAETWSYDAENTANNTKETYSISFKKDTIDTSGGDLTVTGELKNYGSGSGFTIEGGNTFNVGKITNQYGTIILDSTTINSTGNILNQYGAIFQIDGEASQTGDGNLEFQQGSTLKLSDSATFNIKKNVVLYWNANIELGASSTLVVNEISSMYENETGFAITLGEDSHLQTTTGTVTAKTITLGKNAQVTGNVKANGSLTLGEGNIVTGNVNAVDLILNKGATIGGTISTSNSLTLNESSVKLADYAHLKGTYNLNNIGAKGLYSNIELHVDADAKINISLGNNSLAAKDRDNALIWTLYGKNMAEGSAFNVSLSDFILGEDFVEGEIYKIALICSRYSNIEAWKANINLIDDSKFADFVNDSLVWENNTFWVSVVGTNIPEPSTYAAIFGALALAFVAYRRRK